MSKTLTGDTLFSMLDDLARQIQRLEDAQQKTPSVPSGTILSFGGPISTDANTNQSAVRRAPPGFLYCNGDAVNRVTYAGLFNSIALTLSGNTHSNVTIDGIADTSLLQVGWPVSGPGIPAGATVASIVNANSITISAPATATAAISFVAAPYGVGDGTTTFNLPDFRGRAAIGAGQTSAAGIGATFHSLGTTGGEETHLLLAGESGLPLHSHSGDFYPNAGWWQGATHDHYGAGYLGEAPQWGSGTAHIYQQHYGVSIGNQGPSDAGARHNNMQPFVTTNYIIRA